MGCSDSAFEDAFPGSSLLKIRWVGTVLSTDQLHLINTGVIDTRGYRLKGWDRPLNIEVVVQDIKALLDALLIPKAHALIGTSMGGATTVAFASRHSDSLNRFVACDFRIASESADNAAWDQRVQLAKDHGMRDLSKQCAERTHLS